MCFGSFKKNRPLRRMPDHAGKTRFGVLGIPDALLADVKSWLKANAPAEGYSFDGMASGYWQPIALSFTDHAAAETFAQAFKIPMTIEGAPLPDDAGAC